MNILNDLILITIYIIAAIAAFPFHSLYFLKIVVWIHSCLRIFLWSCSGLRPRLIVACILFDGDNCCVVLLSGLLHFLLLIHDCTLRLHYVIGRLLFVFVAFTKVFFIVVDCCIRIIARTRDVKISDASRVDCCIFSLIDSHLLIAVTSPFIPADTALLRVVLSRLRWDSQVINYYCCGVTGARGSRS